MITRLDILLGVLLPAAVACAVLSAGAALGGRWARLTAPLAIAGAFVAAHVALLKLPVVPPLDSTEWLFHAAIALGVLGAMSAASGWSDVPPGGGRWWVQLLALLTVSVGLVWLIVRPLLVFQWPGAERFAWIAGIALVMTLLWMSLDALAARGAGASLLLGLSLVIAAAAGVIALSGSQRLGQTAGMLAAATGAAAVTAMFLPHRVSVRALLLVPAVLFVGLVTSATHHLFVYNGVTTLNATLLLCAPLLAWAGELPPLGRRRGFAAAAARIILPLIPAGIAAILAGMEFARSAADLSEYGY